MDYKEQVSLADYTTLRAGGSARYLFFVASEKELMRASSFADENALPVHILGGGSNTLFSDMGFPGVVIKMEMKGKAYEEQDDGSMTCVVEAGEEWNGAVKETVARGYFGLELLAEIPGTLGGAIVQNIGAYGSEVRESVVWVEAYDTDTKEVVRFATDACAFGYRESLFKKEAGRYVVLRAALKLSRIGQKQMLHKEIETELGEVAYDMRAPEMIAEAVARVRARKLPDWRTIGTAGSFFKNPIVDSEIGARLLTEYPNLVHTTLPDGRYKCAAGWLIDHVANMRGAREGSVGTWESQALVIVNEGRENAEEIRAFVKKVQDAVYEKTGIMLEPEVVMVE